jgi:hypothetical protein
MGTGCGFADVLFSKLADVPPPAAPGRPVEPRIASPSWVHRLEPLRLVSVPFFHTRYPRSASAAPAAGGIPVVEAQRPPRGGSRARPSRTPREQVAITLLNRLGAELPATATDAEVRTAYRHLIRATHPDLHPDGDAIGAERRARTLRAVIAAWGAFQGRAASVA